MRLVALAAALWVVSAGCSSDPCAEVTVDYTIPPVENVLAEVDALVRARLTGFSTVRERTFEAELAVADVLVSPNGLTADELSAGVVLSAGGYDNECGPRSGLALAKEDTDLLVALQWAPDFPTFDSPWIAAWVLTEQPDGTVRFLDQSYDLNRRIDDIVETPTREGLIAAVRKAI